VARCLNLVPLEDGWAGEPVGRKHLPELWNKCFNVDSNTDEGIMMTSNPQVKSIHHMNTSLIGIARRRTYLSGIMPSQFCLRLKRRSDRVAQLTRRALQSGRTYTHGMMLRLVKRDIEPVAHKAVGSSERTWEEVDTLMGRASSTQPTETELKDMGINTVEIGGHEE